MNNQSKADTSNRNHARVSAILGCVVFAWCVMLWLVLIHILDAVSIKLGLSNFDNFILTCTLGGVMGHFVLARLIIFVCENRIIWKEENENLKQG